MYLSFSWLKDFVDIPRSLSAEDLGLKLTMHTVEVDDVMKQTDRFKNVVVGKILEINKHPNADRLQLVKVDIGSEELSIVCGAPNIKAGQLVPVALVGATLPNGMEIKSTEVRGVPSNGMLCAEDEIGLGNDHSGILILDKKAKIGKNLADFLELKDTVFEVDNKSITHRPDLWSHYGIAREISTFLDTKFKEYKVNTKLLSKSTNDIEINAKVLDQDLCFRYMAVSIDNIKVEPSPKWMQDRLIAVGMRPINNIVDITNYVMLEMGQPMHAFDASLIENNGKYNIVVRRAKKKEIIETIDKERRELSEEDLVITDGQSPIAIAGVMGGANSEISDDTKTIVLESANFDFISIRKTSQKLGLRTESSARNEKSLDPNLCEMALIRAVDLIKDICSKSKVSSNLVDEKKYELSQGPINLDLAWLSNRLGNEIDVKEVINILEKLGFAIKEQSNNLEVIIPTWRATRDISLKEDLLEEIARIHGYDNINPDMPKIEMNAPEINQEKTLERRIKNILSGTPALAETYNYSFVGEEQLEKLKIDYSRHVRLVNPITSNHTMLRQSLAPNLLENIKTNQSKYDLVELFEIGNIYLSSEGDINKDSDKKEFLPYQERHIGVVIGAGSKVDVFAQAKGICDHLLTSLGLASYFAPSDLFPGWCDGKVFAEIMIGGESIGSVAKLDSKIKNNLGIKKDVAIMEISFNKLFNLVSNKSIGKYSQTEKYPPAVRDIAFVVDAKILYNDIKNEIISFDKLIKTADLFDIYEGGKLGEGKKSMAFHIVYQAERTFTAEEIDKLQKGLTDNLEKKFKAKIRDF